MNRRRFLALLATLPAGLAAGSVLAQTPPQPAAQQPGPMLYRIIAPGLIRRGTNLGIALSQDSAYQGGAVKVTSQRGQSGTASIFGREYPLVPVPAGWLEGFVAIGTLDPAGPAVVSINVTGGDGSITQATLPLTVLETQWTVDYINFPPPDPNAPPPDPEEVERQAREVERERALLATTYGGTTERKWQGGWISPVDAPVTGYFGEMRSFNGGPVQGHHGGTDFGAYWGTPILATNRGTVVVAENVITRGNMIIVDHGAGIFSAYCHQSEFAVEVGDFVEQGDVIGYVGSTGLSTGAHLHWELSVSGVLVDGLRWLDGTQGF